MPNYVLNRQIEYVMGMKIMDLTEITYFLAIVENKSLLRASEELYVSQSALSQFLTKLEKRIGTPLFLREKDSKRLKLTEAGKLYYEGAKEIAVIQKRTMEGIEKLNTQDQQTIRLGTTGVRSLRFSTQLLSLLQEEVANAHMIIENNHSSVIGPQLLEHTIDFALMALDYFKDNEVQKITLHSEEIGLCIPSEHPILQELNASGITPDTPIDLSRLQNEILVLPAGGSVLERICNSYFEQEHFHPAKALRPYENTSLVSYAKSMSSIGITSYRYVQNEKDILFQRLSRPAFYDLGIAYRRDFELSDTQKRFLELVKEHRDFY